MALTKYRLGQLLELCDERNSEGKYTLDDVKGISIQKCFIETKANMERVSLSPYILVKPEYFAYVTVTSRNGEKITIALNTSDRTYIVSSSYVVFKVKQTELLCSEYLFMYFNRPEFDRYARFNSWGSARETFDWDTMCDMDIELPDITVQRQYVDIYKSMVANQQSYECGLEDLKIVFTGFIEELRRKETLYRIGDFISPYNQKNVDEAITLEQGINIEKRFITPQRSNSNLKGRKIVRHGQFAYCTQLNNENVAIAYREGSDCVVSSVYDVFEITRKQELLPEYLLMWLIRPEFGRYVYWASEGSAYEFLNYDNLANYLIPIPDIKIQKAIAEIFTVYITRKRINEQLKAHIKDICPILIRGSLENGGQQQWQN